MSRQITVTSALPDDGAPVAEYTVPKTNPLSADGAGLAQAARQSDAKSAVSGTPRRLSWAVPRRVLTVGVVCPRAADAAAMRPAVTQSFARAIIRTSAGEPRH